MLHYTEQSGGGIRARCRLAAYRTTTLLDRCAYSNSTAISHGSLLLMLLLLLLRLLLMLSASETRRPAPRQKGRMRYRRCSSKKAVP